MANNPYSNPVFQPDGTPRLFDAPYEEWVSHAHQKYLNQAQPDEDSMAHWIGQMQQGMTPHDLLQHFAASPEGVVNTLHQQYFGRSPDPGNMAGFMQIFQNRGPEGVREAMAVVPESVDYRLGEGYRDAARGDVTGINNMPFVYSNYAAMNTIPQDNMSIMYPQDLPGNQMIQGLLGPLMEQFQPQADQSSQQSDEPEWLDLRGI